MNATQDRDIEARLRRSLHAVADTLTEDAFTTTPRQASADRSRRSRRIALGVGALAVPVALAAGAFVQEGPEYVDMIAPERIVMTGTMDGSRYLLVETDRTDSCGQPLNGVEVVEERRNLVGTEWNTVLYEYGEVVQRECGAVYDRAGYLADPARFSDGGTELGNSFLWVYVVHPEVDTVRITSGDYTKDLTVYEVDGAGYAPFEVPEDMDAYTSELLIDGEVVPGSAEDQTLIRP